MNIQNLKKVELTTIDENTFYPGGNLIAVRSHYCSLYFAYGSLWDSASLCGNGELQLTPTGFATEFDGGGNYDSDCNQVYHIWGEMTYISPTDKPAEDPDDMIAVVIWTALIRGRAIQFLTEISEYEAFSYEEVFAAAYRFWNDNCLDQVEIPETQKKEASKVEEDFFNSWGQGRGKIFMGLES